MHFLQSCITVAPQYNSCVRLSDAIYAYSTHLHNNWKQCSITVVAITNFSLSVSLFLCLFSTLRVYTDEPLPPPTRHSNKNAGSRVSTISATLLAMTLKRILSFSLSQHASDGRVSTSGCHAEFQKSQIPRSKVSESKARFSLQ